MRYERSTENVYACYLNPGTYYYRGRRWNGTGTLSFKTYLGFVADAPRFSVISNTLTAGASAAQVTNVITGNTATIKKNGDYVARLETPDGLNVMVPFTVSGVVEKTILAPTVSPAPQTTVTPKTAPSAAPAKTGTPVQKKVYKVTVSRKRITEGQGFANMQIPVLQFLQKILYLKG
ncbi:MAG: hypothetical protein KH026_04900 [Clostridium sp.]|nr:hypothetical protein [Clostridium sp.]